MNDIRDMEAEAARLAAMTPADRAARDAKLLAHRRSLGLEPHAPMSPEQAWQDLLEKDDRTSPADYPDMALISFQELEDYMRSATPSWAAVDVLAERRRQVEVEGWSAQHDDQQADGAIARAAACYAMVSTLHAASWRAFSPVQTITNSALRSLWPWSDTWWKPKSQRQDLVRAAALILAEIERVDRAASPK